MLIRIGEAQTAFRHEVRSELDKLRDDFRGMIREAAELRPARPAINKPLNGGTPTKLRVAGVRVVRIKTRLAFVRLACLKCHTPTSIRSDPARSGPQNPHHLEVAVRRDGGA